MLLNQQLPLELAMAPITTQLRVPMVTVPMVIAPMMPPILVPTQVQTESSLSH